MPSITSPHLHFEIRTVPWPGKGLLGRIDPGEILGHQILFLFRLAMVEDREEAPLLQNSCARVPFGICGTFLNFHLANFLPLLYGMPGPQTRPGRLRSVVY